MVKMANCVYTTSTDKQKNGQSSKASRPVLSIGDTW